uniref:Uncharacterized protein n=1 Tax=Leviviridae sp. TaxID=2027243 RepID=A0A514DBD8_9VIRU|nr:MAG: hypothetical protein H1Rhizo26FD577_000004 [Leviviridae sp.]
MSFLPGLQDAVSKAYTTLDDIVEFASKGHDVLQLLQTLTLAVADIFHHTGIKPVEVVVPPVKSDQLSIFTGVSPNNPFAGPPVTWDATTRSEKISRDLQP